MARNGDFWEYQQMLLPEQVFTYSVAISADGSTIALGRDSENNFGGAVYLYVRSGSTWVLQQRIISPNPVIDRGFGRFVTLSGDGNVAFIGARSTPNSSYGRVYFYTRTGESWHYAQEVVEAHDGLDDAFGYWAALSADGNTALISDPWARIIGDRGVVYYFKRIGGIWQKQQAFWTNNSPTGYGYFGGSLSLSSDGKLALISTNVVTYLSPPYDSSAYIYAENGGIWTQQQQITIPDQGIEHFGMSVSMSGDGNVLLIGADEATVNNHTKMGAAYIYSR